MDAKVQINVILIDTPSFAMEYFVLWLIVYLIYASFGRSKMSFRTLIVIEFKKMVLTEIYSVRTCNNILFPQLIRLHSRRLISSLVIVLSVSRLDSWRHMERLCFCFWMLNGSWIGLDIWIFFLSTFILLRSTWSQVYFLTTCKISFVLGIMLFLTWTLSVFRMLELDTRLL